MLKIEKDLTLCLNGHSIKLEQAEYPCHLLVRGQKCNVYLDRL